MSGKGLIPDRVRKNLPAFVLDEVLALPPEKQKAFLGEYHRKSKSVFLAYCLWLIGFHYLYLGRWGMQICYWLTGGGLLLWCLIDFFRIPSMVRNHNKDVAIEALKNLKAVSS